MVDMRARLQALDSSQAIVRHFNGEITFWSSGMERLYGFAASEAVGQSAHQLLSTEFQSSIEDLHDELLSARRMGRRTRSTPPRRRKNHRGKPMVAVAGDGLSAVTEVYNDLTDLTAREAHLKSILDTIPDAMIVINAGASCSPSAPPQSACSDTSPEVIGKNIKMLMPSPYREATMVIWSGMPGPASGGSSASAASWSGPRRTAPRFRWSFRSGK